MQEVSVNFQFPHHYSDSQLNLLQRDEKILRCALREHDM
jgi:hypothetical protein